MRLTVHELFFNMTYLHHAVYAAGVLRVESALTEAPSSKEWEDMSQRFRCLHKLGAELELSIPHCLPHILGELPCTAECTPLLYL